ncbi:MAG: DUF1702 family protein [Hamadaea sp.]|uniref:DUF1702 family protein n=1 Tax=Hamadaea sp. NPDC050747 TaxID=3155789 RepID=UPI00182A5E33|nr:DUF1702 family protein [Hamadaea sp.]NUR47363.1 DUF1702 family protein [Hamadaea sp.]NUT08740.1 DUF1702 family protein [Hamadaea sp.]
MATLTGAVRNLLMTPKLADVSFAGRGFPVRETEATRRLEAIPQAVICGFEWAIDARSLWEVERRLELVEAEHRGFAYEGATMAYTVRDAMAGGRGVRAKELLSGSGQPHIFLTYIGIGFAMARLPRPLWRTVLPDLPGTPYYPTMSWLAVDGLGFDRAYFHTRKWVTEQARPKPYPWQGYPKYFARAWDQGVGRALWFIHGGQVSDVAAAVDRFAADRQSDLWSGVGLAATFAGGTDGNGYAQLRAFAGPFAADVAQGAVFAAKARSFSGCEPAHTQLAVKTLAELDIAAAAALADDVAADGLPASAEPDYETWRRLVRDSVPVS